MTEPSTSVQVSQTDPVVNVAHFQREDDPLLACLLMVAGRYGVTLSRDAVVAGLPLKNGCLSPDLVARAAQRGGLSCRAFSRPLVKFKDRLLPAILLLEEHRACVLLSVDSHAGSARVQFPQQQEAEISLSELETLFTGRAHTFRQRFRFDARAPETGQVRHRHWFWSVMRENLALYRDVLFSAFLLSLFALAMPLFIRNVYDRVVPNHAVHTLWVMSAGVGIVIVGDLVLRTMRSYFLDLASKRVDVKLSAAIMERVLGTRLENRPLSAGSFASNLRSFETVRDFITSTTITAFIDLPFALIFIIVIGLIGWQMTIPILIGMLVSLLVALLVQGQMHDLSETTYRAAAQRNATLIESLVGLETLKALGAEGKMQGRWEQSVGFLARISNRLRLLSAVTVNVALWVSQTVNVLIIIIGVYLLIDNRLTMGGLIACSMLSSRALAPIGQVAGLLTQYHHASTAFASLNQIMANPIERPPETRFLSRERLIGDIRFDQVQFCYPNQQTEVLRNLSFQISAGEKVAILGRVGSGKSTLLKLMMGLYQPTGGAVFLDGIDLRQLDPAEVRRSCGYVAQESNLFYGTLRENLAMGLPTVSDEAVVDAARCAALSDFVNAHPQGFDMLIGERGESLSGGQRQGVGIARAVIKNPALYLLDEPTGAMDNGSEEQVKQELRRMSADKTVVLVTHRTSLLSLVDRVIVLDRGMLMADGPRDKVLDDLRSGRVGRVS
ncbi:MAG: type I secretion system permease/ATPase [Desulfuromonas sp.]|nr:MAG: type I secretion system permease/ATPase [Desulfuromonas sp.]